MKSSSDAERLASELGFAARRLTVLRSEPPGLYHEVASAGGDIEQRTWLAFLIAYLCPLQGDEPFGALEEVRRPWPAVEEVPLGSAGAGPRSSHQPGRGAQTLLAYRAWAQRSGSQVAAFAGEQAWSAERRFERVYERLALPGLGRDARFDLLVTLGYLGLYDLRPSRLHLGGDDEVTIAAKRILGIGDPLLLERRGVALAARCGVELAALDLALYNFSRPAEEQRVTLGLGPDDAPDPAAVETARDGLGL